MSKFDPKSGDDWIAAYKKEVQLDKSKKKSEEDEVDWFSASHIDKPPTDLEELFSIYYTRSVDNNNDGIPVNIKFPVWEYNAIMAFAHHNPKYRVGKRVSLPAVVRNAMHKLVYWEAEHLRNPDAVRLFNKYEADRAITERERRKEEVARATDYLSGFESERDEWIKNNQPFMAMRMLLQANKLQITWREDGINCWQELKEKFTTARVLFHQRWGEEYFEDELIQILQSEEPNLQ